MKLIGCFQTVLSTVGLIVTVLCHLKEKQRTLEVLGKVIGVAALVELVELHLLLGWDCLPKLLYFMFMNQKRVSISLKNY